MNSTEAAQAVPNNAATRPRRQWTQVEQSKLFDDYFARLPGICPVCACPVGMMVEHKETVAVMTIRCRGCGNTARVTR
jgi:hypothetical protein